MCFYRIFWRWLGISKDFTCNEAIRVKEVRLIDADGAQLGVVPTKDAQRIADEKELDLVMISPNANPPVCKVMDLGKYIYEQSKKEKDLKEKVKNYEIEYSISYV